MRKVVYDIGMNNGNDTAYYLHLGYDVVAVEANKKLVSECLTRFMDEIEEGRLVIINRLFLTRRRIKNFTSIPRKASGVR